MFRSSLYCLLNVRTCDRSQTTLFCFILPHFVSLRTGRRGRDFFAIFFRIPTRHLTFCVVNREKFLLCKLLSIFHHNESAISEPFVKNCWRELPQYICGQTRKSNRCWGWNQMETICSCFWVSFMRLVSLITRSRSVLRRNFFKRM
jgi:hypothetical protein